MLRLPNGKTRLRRVSQSREGSQKKKRIQTWKKTGGTNPILITDHTMAGVLVMVIAAGTLITTGMTDMEMGDLEEEEVTII